jgi:hypothetical protein
MLDSGAPQVVGQVTVSVGDGAILMNGNAFRVGIFADMVRMRVEGGNGTLRKNPQPAKSYLNVPLSTVIKDIVSNGGETLSQQADTGILNTFLPAWNVMAHGSGGGGGLLHSALRTVQADPQGRPLVWRLWRLPTNPQGQAVAPGTVVNGTPAVPVFDGNVWFGWESWPLSPLVENTDYIYAYEDQSVGKYIIESESLNLTPGVVFRGRQITYVRYEMNATELLKIHAYYE